MKHLLAAAMLLSGISQAAWAQAEPTPVQPFKFQIQLTAGIANADGSVSPQNLLVNQNNILSLFGYPRGWLVGAVSAHPTMASLAILAFNPRSGDYDELGYFMAAQESMISGSPADGTTSNVLGVMAIGREIGFGAAFAPPSSQTVIPTLVGSFAVQKVVRGPATEPVSHVDAAVGPSLGPITSIQPTTGNFGIGLTCTEEEQCGYAFGVIGHFNYVPGRPIGFITEERLASIRAATAASHSQVSDRLRNLMFPN